MRNEHIVFVAPWQVELQQTSMTAAESTPPPGYALVKKRYTLISPGTELACLSGGESWFSMPGLPGYAAVSEIVALGDSSTSLAPGDLVFHYGKHSRYEQVKTSGVFLKLPSGLDPQLAPFTRMATVAMTALRVSSIELGDAVGVTGLGLIGNMAAQLATLQGANVIGIDLSEDRRQLAEQCGIAFTLSGDRPDLGAAVASLTEGNGISTLIEATGVPKVAIDSLPWIAAFGELILLGSPRGEYMADATDIFNYNHLIGRGCITFKGAHEWRFPVESDKFVKHSLVRNSSIVFQLIKSGKLNVRPLISHILAPDQAAEAYEGLRHNKDRYHGVLFDWS